MDLELSAEQEELADSARQFLAAQCPMSLVRQVVEEGKRADDLWAAMVALDWPSLAVPEEHGGIGLGQVELAVVAEQCGRVLAPVPWLATATQFVPAIVEAGSPAQRQRFLSAVSGGTVGTLAVAEVGGRYGAADTCALATPTDGGWRLEADKHEVLDPGWAEEVVVSARLPGTSGGDGVGLFVVPQSALTLQPVHALDATRQLATVVLDGVEVEADRALGRPGHMAGIVDRVMERAAVALCAEAVGTSQAIFDTVLAYVKEREQFGVKIGSFQAMKHKLANMFVALEAARATAYFAAAAIDEDDERRTEAMSVAKSATADCQKLIAQEGIQCLGGIGYTWEHDMHLYVKRQKVQAALFGTGAQHRAALADRLGLR
ncbi:MAG TPA: acyl-CoA dehydrogenase family protein [Acidimicrobiales bacterium]|nr:acyl-CoA dehydrogenase family protein [Acidimicrobiales bacterium]